MFIILFSSTVQLSINNLLTSCKYSSVQNVLYLFTSPHRNVIKEQRFNIRVCKNVKRDHKEKRAAGEHKVGLAYTLSQGLIGMLYEKSKELCNRIYWVCGFTTVCEVRACYCHCLACDV